MKFLTKLVHLHGRRNSLQQNTNYHRHHREIFYVFLSLYDFLAVVFPVPISYMILNAFYFRRQFFFFVYASNSFISISTYILKFILNFISNRPRHHHHSSILNLQEKIYFLTILIWKTHLPGFEMSFGDLSLWIIASPTQLSLPLLRIAVLWFRSPQPHAQWVPNNNDHYLFCSLRLFSSDKVVAYLSPLFSHLFAHSSAFAIR